jgi:hypothetical protein
MFIEKNILQIVLIGFFKIVSFGQARGKGIRNSLKPIIRSAENSNKVTLMYEDI